MFSMIPLLLLVSNVLALPTSDKPYYDLAVAEKYFADFRQKFGKDYKSAEEYNKRFEIFKETLSRVNHYNEIYEALYDVNEFSDLTREEFQATHFGLGPSKPMNTTKLVTVEKEWILNAGDSLDYRKLNMVAEVKNQGRCGSCFVFSAIGNIEGQYAKKHGQVISLSEQQGLDCDPYKKENCELGGWPLHVMEGLRKTGGSMREEDYPYKGVDGQTCRTDTSKVVVQVTGGSEISTPTEEELKGALAQYGPLSTTIYMSPSMMDLHGNSVVAPTDCAGHQINHAILVVGYGTESSTGKDYWIIKNSWGTSWGDQGYFYLERGNNVCSLGVNNSYNAEVA